ncbi:dihydrodipicolinate synthase family protein [Nocardia miyunensis]|uniref:dihydrodipicolinate synthase family protein n=1 Tax=Nocardia miyunensis TaxID=282684 RepID=UPI0008345272|nr:dihydrodipicolinate synthase family protein [Nocardia miyunensis]
MSGTQDVVGIESPVVALLMPFREGGAIDFAALGDYLDMVDAAGVRTVLVNGTTGEFSSLTLAERRGVLEFCRGRWRGRLIAHVGAPAVGDVVELIAHGNDLADALAVIAPYFFAAPTEAGVEAFFAQVLGSARKPVLLYSFPRHTQTVLSPEMVARLAAEFPLMCGVKDSGKDLTVSQGYKQQTPRLQVFLGDDRVGVRVRELRLDGVVTGAGGPVAELPVAIAAAVRAGDGQSAQQWQRLFDRYTDHRKTSGLSDIAFAKAATAARLPGFPAYVRPPLVAASGHRHPDITRTVRDTLDAFQRR